MTNQEMKDLICYLQGRTGIESYGNNFYAIQEVVQIKCKYTVKRGILPCNTWVYIRSLNTLPSKSGNYTLKHIWVARVDGGHWGEEIRASSLELSPIWKARLMNARLLASMR